MPNMVRVESDDLSVENDLLSLLIEKYIVVIHGKSFSFETLDNNGWMAYKMHFQTRIPSSTPAFIQTDLRWEQRQKKCFFYKFVKVDHKNV